MNPCTLGWYLPLLVKDLPGALQPSDGDRPSETAALPPAPGSSQGPRRSALQGAEKDLPHSQQQHPSSGSGLGPPSSQSHPSSTARHGSSSTSAGAVSLPPQASGDSPSDAEHEVARPHTRERGRHELLWRELDAKFRRDLPDDAYVGRLAYRGLVMRACPHIRMLDGVEVERKERDKAEKLLRSVFGASPGGGASGAREAAGVGAGTGAEAS
ncbi:hypothetical protein TRAPUB_11380 [Trametes pubescens]|uniref:Uncharacterized protein n=1 Tax=Trametes pubescens TaxID=154538 RepID=A0A1M2VWW3_TRAPU|nr:hypothetical protein TRAPUB_11380 [Trametes pubescens]